MNEEKSDSVVETSESKKETINDENSNEEKEKLNKNAEERRICLLNNPNYGVILCFIERFRSHIELQDYSLQQLEENLLSDQENVSRQLIDFHLNLLKRISWGKGAKRDKFLSIITKFAYRYDLDDGDFLKQNGYSGAQIETKLRILKNLFESQLDFNPVLKTSISEKASFEIRSQCFGRDRSGASYWLFTDVDCFIRVFREEPDDERSWKNVVKDKEDFEKLVVLLLTDRVIRKKFPEIKFAHEPFNTLESSDDFQKLYFPFEIHVKKEEVVEQTKAPPPSAPIKSEKNELIDSPKVSSPINVKTELDSENESSCSAEKNGERSRAESLTETNQIGSSQEEKQEINNNQPMKKRKKTRGRRKSTKKRRSNSSPIKKEEKQQPAVVKTKKRKQIVEEEKTNNDEKIENSLPPQESQSINIEEENFNDDNMPIALRRSKRVRKPATNEIPLVTSSPAKSLTQTPTKKKMTNGKIKNSSQIVVKMSSKPSKSKGNKKRSRRRAGSSNSEDDQPSTDEEEYNSDDYLPEKNAHEQFDDELLEEEEEEDEYVPRRSAKTVAKRRGQMTTENVEETNGGSSSCCVCSKSDRPECLLLCDDCDDPYHLDCLKPILLSVPDGDWFCPVCEHKRLVEKLVEKFVELLKEHEQLEIKRNQLMSKRSNRLANVTLNLDLMVNRTTKKSRTNGIVDSDEELDDEQPEEEQEDDDAEEESVYDFRDDESFDEKPKSKGKRREKFEPENLGVRSCRRKPQNYRFDDYDQKMKEAMMVDGENYDEIEKESETESEKRKSKRSTSYEKDEDFDVLESKHDDEFAPDLERNSDSESEEAEDFDDESTDNSWKKKSKSNNKKKLPARSSKRRKARRKFDDDSFSDEELNNFVTFDTTKSGTTTDADFNDTGNDEPRRSSRTTKRKNHRNLIVSDDEDDEDYSKSSERATFKRMKYKKRSASDDSFIADDDDYEKIAQKREIVKHNKNLARTTINDHLKKFTEQETTNSEPVDNEDSNKDKPTQLNDDNQKLDEHRPSDDDDFPDEQEIFKANGLLTLKKTVNGPVKDAIPFRPAFMAPGHSYQHAIVDPTARFAMIRPATNPIRPPINNACPSNGPDEAK